MGANRQSTIKNQKWLGARGEIRTHHETDLKSAASSNWATRAKNFGFEISDFGFSAVVGPIKSGQSDLQDEIPNPHREIRNWFGAVGRI